MLEAIDAAVERVESLPQDGEEEQVHVGVLRDVSVCFTYPD